MPRASAAVHAGQVTTLLYQKSNSLKRIYFSWLILACFGCRYDAGGEGACLKRYTDPSFRAHSAQHQRILHETKPDIQSSDIHSKPPAEEARHKKYSKFKTGALSDMLRQLKYRHIIGRIRHQKQNFQNQDSSQDEASEAPVWPSANSPEMSDTEAPCPAVPVNKEGSSYLVERTSSFGAWLSPGAASTRACDITEDNADGFDSHGANKADENANIATNARSALVDFIASRGESSRRKLSVKKHDDPLTESFRNMAKKLLLENGSTENLLNNKLVHSEDVPDPDEIAFYSKSAEDTQQDAEQCDHPCE
ncbi:uncharacterized protein [Triticum aestivum]|uniref:uncharacterized protein n=1 Tax=Triticum aestivum TaxID=4565 RepID=UPI001D0062A1|nr:uncharacterized protein LOC123187374 [Triticum aestivum]